jgi:hypothetical protein
MIEKELNFGSLLGRWSLEVNEAAPWIFNESCGALLVATILLYLHKLFLPILLDTYIQMNQYPHPYTFRCFDKGLKHMVFLLEPGIFLRIRPWGIHLQNETIHYTLNVCSRGILFSRESQCFPRRSRGKHWDSRENKIHYFPREHTLSALLYRNNNIFNTTILFHEKALQFISLN